MKCVFLDFDGVFNTTKMYNNSMYINGYGFNLHFNIKHIEDFVKIFLYCREHNIKICMTSSNSLNKSKEDWENFILKIFRIPIPNVIIGIDSRQDRDRGLFIEDFIVDNNIKKYLIVDDDIRDIQPYHKSKNILHINKEYGITIIDMLKIKNYFEN